MTNKQEARIPRKLTSQKKTKILCSTKDVNETMNSAFYNKLKECVPIPFRKSIRQVMTLKKIISNTITTARTKKWKPIIKSEMNNECVKKEKTIHLDYLFHLFK